VVGPPGERPAQTLQPYQEERNCVQNRQLELHDSRREAQAASSGADCPELLLFAKACGTDMIELIAHSQDELVRTDGPSLH
jgi:hypothetical protein